jgi:RHS repeat-associated protein
MSALLRQRMLVFVGLYFLSLTFVHAQTIPSGNSKNMVVPYGLDPDFGNVIVGETAEQNVGLAFVCNFTIDCLGVAITDVEVIGARDFTITDNGCEGFSVSSVPAGGSAGCSVTVSFTPSAAISEQAAVAFTYVINGTTSIFSINVSGTGIPSGLPPINSTNSCAINASSIINTDTMSLGETIPLVGVPFSLKYSSDRFRVGFSFSQQSIGLGGWSPSIVHHYDVRNQVFYGGDGSLRPVQASSNTTGYYLASADASEVYYFDPNGIHFQTKDALTGVAKLNIAYDSNGRLLSLQDQFGNTTSFQYTNSGALLTSPYGQQTSFTYDGNGFLASVTNPNSETYTLTNNDKGFLVSFQKPGGQTSTTTYSSSGAVVKDTGAGGNSIMLSSEFDPINLVQSVTSTTSLGRQTVYQTTANGSSSSHTVTEPTGETLSSLTPNLGLGDFSDSAGVSGDSIYVADPRFGQMSSYQALWSSAISSASINIETTKTIQANLANASDPLSLISLTTTTTLQGDPTRTFTSVYTAPNMSTVNTSPLNRTTTTTLNSLAQIASVQTGSLSPASFRYDSHGRLSNLNIGANRNMTLTYDGYGNVATSTDFLGHTTSFVYDKAGRVVKQTQPDGSIILFSYDLNGNLISLTPPSRPAHEFSYNLFELLQTYLPPALGGANIATNYSYNLDKQLSQISLPTNQVITYTYGPANGLLEEIATPNGDYQYSYVPNTSLISGLTSPDAESLTFGYAGNVLTNVASSGPVTSNLNFLYNTDGSVAALSLQNGAAQAISYDKDGLTVGSGSLSMTRDQNGLVTATNLSSIGENLSYDSFGEMTSDQFFVQKAGKAFEIYDKQFVRDNLGRIIDIKHSYFAPYCASQFWGLPEEKYIYDSVGRLIEASGNFSPLRRYVYDENGNRVQKIEGGQVITAEYDNQDRLLKYGQNEYVYDNNGTLIQKTTTTPQNQDDSFIAWLTGFFFHPSFTTKYTFDVFGNLKSVGLPNGHVISYIVDGQNRRVGKLVDGKLVQGFVYSSQTQIVGELDGQGNLVKQFIYGTKPNIPDYVIMNGKKFRIISNQVGTPRYVVDASTGNVVEFENTDEFGYQAVAFGSVYIPFGFAGGLYDNDTGLVRMGAREYDPETGRWLQRDPILFKGGDTNLYGYVLQDPINSIDISGHGVTGQQVAQIITIIGGGLSGAANICTAVPDLCSGWLASIFGAKPPPPPPLFPLPPTNCNPLLQTCAPQTPPVCPNGAH